jgi:hypothetical protein
MPPSAIRTRFGSLGVTFLIPSCRTPHFLPGCYELVFSQIWPEITDKLIGKILSFPSTIKGGQTAMFEAVIIAYIITMMILIAKAD